MKGGLLGNIILVIISVVLIAIILGLFFGVNLIGMAMDWLTVSLFSAVDYANELINEVISAAF